jgi:uncharacterized membrane protein YGL010W
MPAAADGKDTAELSRVKVDWNRLVDQLFLVYDKRHATSLNRLIQWIAVPLSVWAGIAMLVSLPVPALFEKLGIDWAVLAAIAGAVVYALLSVRVGLALLVFEAACIAVSWWYLNNGALPLWQPAIAVFTLCWLAGLVGDRVENRSRKLTEIAIDLFMAPAAYLRHVLNLLRIGY